MNISRTEDDFSMKENKLETCREVHVSRVFSSLKTTGAEERVTIGIKKSCRSWNIFY